MTPREIASMIDHTLLKADAVPEQISKLCTEAGEYGFASVCINPCYVPLAAKELAGSDVKVCTVIGFPLGANTSQIKAEEAMLAVEQGASEVDMVMNIGALKAGDYALVESDIRSVVRAAGRALVKVIIETFYLSEEEKIKATEIVARSGAAFVKTSTGFAGGGATVEDVRLMKKAAGNLIRVKAAGGVRNYDDALAMIEAGASRIGTSGGISIVEGGSNAGPGSGY
ncbi:deoxyribose-phosphate aldolase [Marispirochaeta aestuarii]|uniref:Deoxyribose-phosphate aldolase n=1 Tax=Marispirochaeta aestuarii TaxID=1963862 RepID=A0A1Y1RX57_9SPIO|nr:deoxyribose-phosphate aldolase [Marispirochaeta aestuarii]ORC34821.1 deoxyribose-phosphate aldolase [Marispirochaeta aestuarii]